MSITLTESRAFESRLLCLSGKVAVIAGGAGGIGGATARSIAQHGADIILVDANPAEQSAELSSDIKSLGRKCFQVQCDVTQSASLAEAARQLRTRCHRIDILFNNAGYTSPARFQDLTEEEWNLTVEVGLRGVFLCCREFGRMMIEQRSGNIINAASIAGIVGMPHGFAHYSAASGGIASFTRTLAVEWAKYGIRANCIASGQVTTPALGGLIIHQEDRKGIVDGIPVGHTGEPDEIAAAVLFLASDASQFINGHTLVVDGGMTIR